MSVDADQLADRWGGMGTVIFMALIVLDTRCVMRGKVTEAAIRESDHVAD